MQKNNEHASFNYEVTLHSNDMQFILVSMRLIDVDMIYYDIDNYAVYTFMLYAYIH